MRGVYQQAAALGADGAEAQDGVEEQERKRRAKISAANKGRTPWNKGRKHPPEVIARIREATRLAMQRPEVQRRLAAANQKREPHTDEAKEKIRVKLLERADRAREEINEQAAIVLGRLADSEDPALRACAEYDKAQEVIAGLAWQFFKKDWQQVSTTGWEEGAVFRERCVAKLQTLIDRKRRAALPKRKSATGVDKVRQAMQQLKKLQQAKEKVAAAEVALAKLQAAKAAYSDNQAVCDAHDKASGVVVTLRAQVAKLEEALQPLQQQLGEQWDDKSAGIAPGGISLEQRLEAEAMSRQQQEQQHQAAAAAAAEPQQPAVSGNAVAAPGAAVAASSNGAAAAGLAAAVQQQQQQQPSKEVGPAGNGAVINGHATNGRAVAAAMPARTAMPWQR